MTFVNKRHIKIMLGFLLNPLLSLVVLYINNYIILVFIYLLEEYLETGVIILYTIQIW